MPTAVATHEEKSLPPPYHLTPKIEPFTSSYTDRKYPLKVETDLQQRKIDAGQFLTGTVNIQALSTLAESASVTLTIWSKISTYKSKGKFLTKRNTLIQSNMLKLKRSIIPLVSPLKEGLCYSYPFSIQFPEHDEMPSCKCAGHIHSASPPSCLNENVHVEYYLTAIIRNQSKRCWQSFYYQPTRVTFDLSQYRDTQGQVLMRMHRSIKCARLSASAWPVHNTPEQVGGYARLYVNSKVRIDMVRIALEQHTATKPEGFGDMIIPNDAIHEIKQISSKVLVGSWPAGTEQIDVPYELPTMSVPPSHVGCYSAVLYFLKLELCAGQETCILSIPLTICTEGEQVPEYPSISEPIKL